MRNLHIALAAALLALAPAARADDARPAAACTGKDSECAGNQLCESGKCVDPPSKSKRSSASVARDLRNPFGKEDAGCRADGDCKQGRVCGGARACRYPTAAEARARKDAEKPAPPAKGKKSKTPEPESSLRDPFQRP